MHNLPPHLPAPPRRVPLSLRIVNFFNGGVQMGFVIFGFGFLFFVMFGLNADYSFATFRDAGGRTTGRVTLVESTGASENDSPVQASHYEYSVAGTTFQGKSYATGYAPAQGEAVTVEYVEGNPSRSRIEGMRRAMFGPWAGPVSAIFPTIGLVMLGFGMREGARRNRLLRNGLLTRAVLAKKEGTSMMVNRRPVLKLTFEFTDRLGQRQRVITRTSTPEDLQDEREEPLLYDPEHPSRAYLLDEVPSRPSFEMNGELVGRGVAALGMLIIPTAVVGAYALLFAIKYDLLRL